jgi:ketosteroid isomerase-like protein
MDIQTDPTPLETAQVYLARLLAGDVAGLEASMTEDFTWSFLPKSLGIPVRTKPQSVTQLKTLGAIFASLKVCYFLSVGCADP